jgi:iron(III) transport system substrate-binding protein
MSHSEITRRRFLHSSAAVAATAACSTRVAAAPAAEPVTPALVEAAKKEGRVVWYNVMDLPVAERLAKAFEATYPGVAVRVERTGAERLFTRLAQEMESRIHSADVVNSSDAAHFVIWKRDGWLAPYVPQEVAQYFPEQHRDSDGLFATSRVWLSSLGYNTKLVKPEDAPKSFADLLDPKWAGKIVKGHPAYSGTIMTATFQTARALGWEYYERLAKQRVMQVQSSTDPPKKLALGERAVMADGNDYNVVLAKEAGQPVEVVYPSEGTPLISAPSGILKGAPNPHAARLFQSWLLSGQTQQLLVDFSAQHSVHARVKEKAGRPALATIKTFKDDPVAVEAASEDIKARYAKLFRV